MNYNPNSPAEFDGERFAPMRGPIPRTRVKLSPDRVNLGALNAMNRALHDLANPLPPVTRWFRFARWVRARRSALGVWYRWKRGQFQSFRFGLGCTVGSWIAGDDIR